MDTLASERVSERDCSFDSLLPLKTFQTRAEYSLPFKVDLRVSLFAVIFQTFVDLFALFKELKE